MASGAGVWLRTSLRCEQQGIDAGMVPILDPLTIVNFGVWIGRDEFLFFFLKEWLCGGFL